jgi:hypothetical protein
MVQLQGSPDSGWQATLASGAEQYVDDVNVREGNLCKLEIGIYTGAAFEYVHYHDCAIASASFGWQDGGRTAQISLVPDSIYNTGSMSNPFYMQFQNRQYKFDPIADLGNMEKMGGTQFGPAWSLSYDFWDTTLEEGWTYEIMQGNDADVDDWTPDITTFADAYPVIDQAITYQFKIFGWSRAGCQSTQTGTGWQESDTTSVGTNNPTHKGLLLLEDLDGTRSEIVLSTLSSAHDHFPQSYRQTRAGSYPIIYEVDGATYLGWKIIKMGVRTTVGSANVDNWNTFYLSRVEMPAIIVHPTRDNNTNEIGLDVIMDKTLITPWQVVERKDLNYNTSTAGSYACKTGYIYAVVVQGDIEYIRNGIHYIQDMRFYACQDPNDASYTTPTWSRSYPPGTGPTAWQAFTVTGKESPYRGTGTEVFRDNYGSAETPDLEDHCYYFMHDETAATAMVASTIDPEYVPYVFGGAALTYEFTLFGSGAVTLVRNDLQVFLFECPAPVDPDNTPWEEMMFYGYRSGYNQVPAPKQFKLPVPGYTDIIPDYLNIWAYNTMKGTPQALFSGSPYSGWNFDEMVRVQPVGPYTYVGCIGHATDAYNYLCAWLQDGYIGIGKMRDGVLTTLATQAATIYANKCYDLRFWHRDGKFGVEYKKTSAVWPTRGSQLTYTWTDADGPMAGKETDDVSTLVLHMGLFSYINPPVFRTTGFLSSQNKVPVMPLDHRIETDQSDFADDALFPDTGDVQIDIGGIIYQYNGKTDTIVNPVGPYQGRNIQYWTSYDHDMTDNYYFDDNWAVESTHYENLVSQPAGNSNGWAGGVVAIDTGYSYVIHEVFFRPWITTGGNTVYERERIRIYSSETMDADKALSSGLASKIWVTNALLNVTPITELDEDYTHPEGSFVFLHNNDQSMCFGFVGVSGDYDQSLTTLLDTFCKISGTGAVFPNDFTSSGGSKGNGDVVNLQ